jgi:hypothetical protein
LIALKFSLRASSAFKLFELGLRSLELSSLGQQCLQIIRAWTSVPQIIFFGPAAPSNYLSSGFSPSSYLLRASSATALFEYGCQSLELSFSGQQRLSFTRVWVLDPSIRIFRPSAFLFGLRSLKSLFRAINALRSKYPNFGGNILVRMSYVKYEGKSTVCNTRWLGIRIKRTLPRNFSYLRYEVCTDGRIGCLAMNWASTW